MFFLTYLRREMRHRIRQVTFIAVGLAVGIGLVVVVTSAATGVKNAQAAVLHALYGIGTDITVTTAPGTASSTAHGSGAFSPGKASEIVDQLTGGSLGLIDESFVARIARLPGVADAIGGLAGQTDTRLTVPSLSQLGPGGRPPASALNPVTFFVDGVGPAGTRLGPYASGTIGSGRGLRASDATARVAVVDSSYAEAHKLKVGSAIAVAGKSFTVIGTISQPPTGGAPADVYIPLAVDQQIGMGPYGAGLRSRVDTIYVAAASSADIAAVREEISALLPAATVSTSASLASAVTGSLASTASLANDLGRWLAIAVLLAAFAVASLLTSAAVGRRVREFGTLKALGWRSRRIVAQVLGEALVMGIAGAILGVAAGLGGAAVISAIAPPLSATVGADPGGPVPQNVTFNGGGRTSSTPAGYYHTVTVHLTAPVTLTVIVLAVLLALAGGLVAGALGGWRAARLRPAAALASVE
ncbi:MAG TPA: ABC transporter permease [Streptosporangiaceae bacterium]|nr:ABC transporter permease [Streptosporangiaceae bacterium]